MIRVGLEWFLARTGAAATTHLETGHRSYLISRISYLISRISRLISHISYLVSHLSYLVFPNISNLISHIYLTSHISYLLSNRSLYAIRLIFYVSYLLSHILILSNISYLIFTVGGFIRSDPGVPHPNIQFHFFPSQVVDHGRKPPELEAYQVIVRSLLGCY